MTKVLSVIYLICLSIGSTAAYAQECAVGPEYWCKSFQNAEDCGAIRHCTDTVWTYDNKHTLIDSSITCQWCERIFENIHKGIEQFEGNQDMIISTLTDGCKLLPSQEFSSKCTNTVEKYGEFITSLMKNKRYATLCNLMSICSSESIIEKPPIIIGQHRCTWGPSYWCSSLSNVRECNAIDHCSNQHWSKQAIENKDNICKYCEFIIEKLRTIITDNQTEINVEKWLSGACSMLKTKDLIDKCVETMSQYGKEILILIKNNIDSGIICHLGEMCKEASIVLRMKVDDNLLEQKEYISMDEQSKMLCNVIVHATHELYIKQKKNENEIKNFLKIDCQQFSTLELIPKCEDLVNQYSDKIYGYVVNNMELSKVCDYIDNFAGQTAFKSQTQIHCELCTFVLATTKSMLDKKYSEDKILLYIDEHLCSHFNGEIKQNCKYMIETNRQDLFDYIQQEKQSMLLCTYFQVCLDEVIDKTSSIEKNEMHSFLQHNICDYLGPFENSCHALVEKDTTRLLKTLVDDMEGDVLCQIFGICPTKESFIADLSLNDDANKCKRCINDFARRKHIAEKVVTYASQFLYHLCGQLPQENECTKSVNESINKLIQFIQSLNPQEICVELKICNQTLAEEIQIISSNNIISEEIITYIKNEICAKFGPLSKFCDKLMNSEGTNLFTVITKNIDPHKVCNIIDICPKTTAFENCNDKCECCVAKVENYQLQIAAFLETMLTTARVVCQHMPDSSEICQTTADEFESIINEIIIRFNSKQICQTLTHCSISDLNDNKCLTCTERLQLRKDGFLQAIDRIAGYFNDLCQKYSGKQCQIYVKQIYDSIQKSFEEFDPTQACTLIGFCTTDGSKNEIDFDQYEKYFENEIEKNICSILGPFNILCKQVIHGNLNQIQTLKINYDIKDLMKIGEELIDNLSNTEDLNESSQDKCQYCLHQVIQKKRNIKFISNKIFFFLQNSCNYCPAKNECRTHWHIAKFQFDLFIDNIKPKYVCIHFGFCNQSSSLDKDKENFHDIDNKLEIKQIDKSNSICILCEYIMNILSNYIHYQSTEQEIVENLQKICNQIPSILQNQCHDYINNYSPVIITILLQEFNLSKICHKLNLCTNEMKKFNITYLIKADLSMCGICDYILTYLNFNIKRNLNEKSIQHTLSTVCSHLSNEQNPKCELLIDLFSPYIQQLELNSKNNFCKQLIICQIPMIELKPAISIKKEDTTKQLIINTSTMKDKTKESLIIEHLTDTPKCTLCHYVISYLDAILKNNKSEQAVEEALARVCTILPGKQRSECDEFIKTYGPVLAQLIAEMADPLTVCLYLRMCENSLPKQPPIIIDNFVHKQTPYTCTICQFIINRMKYFIGLNQEKTEVFTSLNEACDLFSVSNLKEQCKDFLNQRGLYFFPMISNDIEPKIACQNIGICGEHLEISTTTSAPISSSTKYGKCIFGMNYWCTSRENAKLCNAVELCERQVWSKKNIVIY